MSFRVVMTVLALNLGAAAAAETPQPPAEPVPRPLLRQPARPAWEIDLTERLICLGEQPNEAAARQADGEPYAHAMSRARQAQMRPTLGGVLWWRLPIELPAPARSWPVVVEFDAAKVISAAWLDDVAQDRPIVGSSSAWIGTEGHLLLPLAQDKTHATLHFRAAALQTLYENGFGRVRLRPAELSEILQFERAEGRLRVRNRSAHPVTIDLRAAHEDFFGVELAQAAVQLRLAAGADADWKLPTSTDPALYKTRITVSSDGHRPIEYWALTDFGRENRHRPQVLKLREGWQWQMSSQPLGATPPADGWHNPVTLPHAPSAKDWTSHWMWYRKSIRLPAEWAGQRVQLFVPVVKSHAAIFINGRKIRELAQWELPAYITLPHLAPGQDHELAVGVTDYIVGLAPGVPVPAGGKSDLPSRGLAAPIDTGIGLASVPELVAAPALRVDWVGIRTQTVGRTRLEAAIEIANDDGGPTDGLAVRALLLDRGQILDRAQTPLTSGHTATISMSPPNVRPWELDDPKLYELRVELLDAAGNVLDTSRERFGFREFAIRDDHFILNGRRANLNGGTHVSLTPAVAWPVRPSAYRILRYYYPRHDSFMGGRGGMYLADELGLPIKAEIDPHNALHRDKYAYQHDVTWQRIDAQLAAMHRILRNHPSVIMWDVGNELWFGGKGEAARMVNTYNTIRSIDPTRLVTNSGGHPAILPGAEMLDWHGWPSTDTRSTWFFFNPAKRPAYWRDQGLFAHIPPGEPREKWQVLSGPERPTFGWPLTTQGDDPAGRLMALDGRPILFSEGHYYENGFVEAITGLSGRVPIPDYLIRNGFDRDMQQIGLNWTAVRRLTVQNMRLARAAGSIIHVDRGVGRWIQPLAVLSEDRRTRFPAGSDMTGRFAVLNDVSGRRTVHARWTLFDGDHPLAWDTFEKQMDQGDVEYVDLRFALPPASSDAAYRLHIECWADGFDGYFRDDITITAMARDPLSLPQGQRLMVFDPPGQTAAYLAEWQVPFTPIETLSDLTVAADSTLLIGSEALTAAAPDQLAALRAAVQAGARVILLDHRQLPAFLKQRLVQSRSAAGGAYFPDSASPLAAGLIASDLRFWQNRDEDWLVTWGGLEMPSSGNFRVHAQTEQNAIVLEVAEGDGRVLFCQLNLGSALGVDPAAHRILANLLQWTGAASPFARHDALIVSGDAAFTGTLRARLGVVGDVVGRPSADRWQSTRLAIVDGRDVSARDALAAEASAVRAFVAEGGTLVIQGLDPSAGPWLSALLETEIAVEPFTLDRAWLLAPHPLTSGLSHGSLWWHTRRNAIDFTKSQPPLTDSTSHFIARGPQLKPLTAPAYLSVLQHGQGRVLLNCTRAVDYPVTRSLSMTSQVLSNAGARLIAGGIREAEPADSWEFHPVPLGAHANHSLSDDPAGRRGWHQGGAENDMRMFPRGRQDLRGVIYDLIDPEKHDGNGVIALAGTVGKGTLPQEVKGIAVGRRAERLYFLHNSAWGSPGFTYRVWYTEDRARWIPGMPDPYVDVTVDPKANIADWWGVQAYDSGDAFLPGATVAWMGQNDQARRHGNNYVGVLQMVWDNPSPEKEIHSIDILSPGTVGAGQVFVFAITAASRSAEGDKAVSTSAVLPKGVDPSSVFAHERIGRYGMVLLRNGRIAALHDRAGNVLMKNIGWSIQGNRRPEPAAPMEFFGIEQQNRPTSITRSIDPEGNVVFDLAETVAKHVTWSQKVVCKPSGIVLGQSYRLARDWPKEQNPSLFLTLECAVDQFDGGVSRTPNERPITIGFKGGLATIDFEERFLGRWFRGYAAYENAVRFYPFDRQATEPGAAATVRVEISLP